MDTFESMKEWVEMEKQTMQMNKYDEVNHVKFQKNNNWKAQWISLTVE